MTSTSGLTARISQTLFTSNSFVEEVASILQHWDTGLEASKRRIQDAKEKNSTVLDLQQLELSNEIFNELWPSIREIRNLKLTELPSDFGALSTLETLNLACNPLQSVPDSFSDLAMLRELDLGFTSTLCTVPEIFEKMTQLKVLYAGNNRLEKLPESVISLQCLEELHLYGNALNALPENIGNLKSLRLLNVGRNNLSSLPNSIGSLSSLEVLYLYENDLSSLPRSMKDLSKLRVLGLDGNPSLSSLPEHIKEPNAKAVAAYYAEME